MLWSVFLILVIGLLASKLFALLKLPGLLGMILTGVAIGPYGLDLIEVGVLSISSDIRMLALIVILLRAGLGINKDTLRSVGTTSLKMSAIPCLMEGFAVMLISSHVLGLGYVEAGILGFTVAAVSPAVIVPSMIALKEKRLGMDKGIPVIILAGASIDDVFAITLFTSFLGLYFGDGFGIGSLLSIPIQIILGILFGLLIGYIVFRIHSSDRFFQEDNERLLLVISLGIGLILLESRVEMAGLLGVMTVGFYLLNKMKDRISYLEARLNDIWFFAQIFLFVLIGAEVNLSMIPMVGIKALLIVLVGLTFRAMGVFISLYGSNLNGKEKLFCAIAYIPKATVQAAIGAIPLAQGVESGETILAISVLAILLTAPIGAIGMDLTAKKLLNGGE